MHSSQWHAWFQLVHVFTILSACLGAVIGAAIGIPFGNWQLGLGIGAVVGAVIGLVGGLIGARRMSSELNKPVIPPPSGWRRWDDEED
jgi:uncharacterized membrane protein